MATKKDAMGKKASVKKVAPTDKIRNRANEIFRERTKKGIHGDADSDWLQAEKELNK